MEQRQYFPKAQKRRLRRERLKKWFSETFRAHSKEEYKEFFTRGFDGKEALNRVYPWAYMRMLVFCFLLFAATTFFMRVSGNAISFPAMVFLGAILVNLPFITLIYELCPKTDLSFLKLMFVLVVGGTASVIISELGYLAFVPENEYASVAWTAVLEELAKVIPAIAVILIMKKRKSPLTCFALAAAVGAGISIIEDMGYILFESFDGNIDLVSAITVSVMRGVSGVATHTVWVGYVGWIFSKCKKPFLDVRFYAVCLMSMALHFLWDLIAANGQIASALGILFGFIFCICFTRWLVKKERRLVLEAPEILPLAVPEVAAVEGVGEAAVVSETVVANEAETAVATETAVANGNFAAAPVSPYAVRKEFPEDTPEIKIKKRARYSQLANIIAAVAAIILGITALSSCFADVGYGYKQKTFTANQKQEFISYVQNGYNLKYDWNRPLDKASKWYAYSVVDGKYTAVTQIVDEKYLYTYYWFEAEEVKTEAENGEATEKPSSGWQLSDISVKIGDKTYPCITLDESLEGFEAEETEELSCYIIRDEVIAVYHDSLFGGYVVVLNETVFYGLGTIISYAVGMGAVIFVGALLFILFKVQSKNLAKQIAASAADENDGKIPQENASADVVESVADEAADNGSGGGESDEVADNGSEENFDNGGNKDVE